MNENETNVFVNVYRLHIRFYYNFSNSTIHNAKTHRGSKSELRPSMCSCMMNCTIEFFICIFFYCIKIIPKQLYFFFRFAYKYVYKKKQILYLLYSFHSSPQIYSAYVYLKYRRNDGVFLKQRRERSGMLQMTCFIFWWHDIE